MKKEYSIGYDIGSSSIKAALYSIAEGKAIEVLKYPESEMEIIAILPGWAEQHPSDWWTNICILTKQLITKTGIHPSEIKSIGIAYQMHGLVIVDKDHQVIRPSIIWCDSRAVNIGEQAFSNMGEKLCLSHFLNSPGNFTASKLKWVADNEPNLYERIYKCMLPGDYINMMLSGDVNTTISGLSEGILWDFEQDSIANELLDYYGISADLIPDLVPTFGVQGKVTSWAAEATGLHPGTPITYRAGDQPNNALSLSVMQPNEVAATGGTSGVVYGISDHLIWDEQSRINGFAHVNHTKENPRIGSLLCINGAGIMYAWIKQNVANQGLNYSYMEQKMAHIPVGSDGLRIIPFGNGAERVLGNVNTGAQMNNLQFNRHTREHMFRAALEGIAFSFAYGCELLKSLGIPLERIKAGNDNLFQSDIFSQTISEIVGCDIDIYNTTGAIGAAKASIVAIGDVDLNINEFVNKYSPSTTSQAFKDAYQLWKNDLNNLINQNK